MACAAAVRCALIDHPAWMYASSHKCAGDGWPRPPGCENETAGLWVYPRYNAAVFPKLGPHTKLLVVPPVYGARAPCNATPSVWCTQQNYTQWLELNRGNLSFYRDWAFSDERIVGFDPWPLHSNPKLGATTSEALGLGDMPEMLSLHRELGIATARNH
jgi:hypothetical protein